MACIMNPRPEKQKSDSPVFISVEWPGQDIDLADQEFGRAMHQFIRSTSRTWCYCDVLRVTKTLGYAKPPSAADA